jgi:hypothetical protein
MTDFKGTGSILTMLVEPIAEVESSKLLKEVYESMRHLWIKTLAGSGLLLMTLTANAQYQPRYDSRYDYRYTQDERATQTNHRILDRTRDDLDNATSVALPFTGDRSRAVRAREEINECRELLASGDYDRRQFDQAVAAIQRVVDMNRMSDRNRDNLRDDIRDLRDLQARYES